jgi:putative membrane protein
MLFRWLLLALILLGLSNVMPGITVEHYGWALLAVIVVSAVNTLIRPLFIILTLPINILTLGLFTFIINALLLQLAFWITPGVGVDGFWNALAFSVIFSMIKIALGQIWRENAGA